MANNELFYGQYRDVVNSISNRTVSNYKRSNLKWVKNSFASELKNANIKDADIQKISRLIGSVVTALEETDVGGAAFEAAREVAKSYKGERGISQSEAQKKVDNLRKTLDSVFTGLDTNINRVDKEIRDFYSKNGITPGSLGAQNISERQLKQLNQIYEDNFKNIPAARTALSNLLSILPTLSSGSMWKYESPQALSRGLAGYISNIVGSFTEKKFAEIINNLKRSNKVLDFDKLETQLVGAANSKSDLNLKLVDSGNAAKRAEQKLVQLSLKSYKVTRRSGVALHGTTAETISRTWKSKGQVQSNPIASKVIAMANARGLLNVRDKTISVNQQKFKRDFGDDASSIRTTVQANLMTLLKNSLYFNADMFFGNQIMFLVGRGQYMNASEFIDRLLNNSKGMTARISGSEENPTVDIVAFLAAEGRN